MMRASYTVLKLVILVFLALANLSPSFISIWRYDGSSLHQVDMAEMISPRAVVTPPLSATLSGEEYCLFHADEKVTIKPCGSQSGAPSWSSPDSWQVKEALFSDLNLDGEEEIALLVWRPFKPWPVDRFMPHGGRNSTFHDEKGMSCQIILIGLVDGVFRERWAGSALAAPVHSVIAADLDGDGLQELAALEYAYEGNPDLAAITVWVWNGFGFSLETRQNGPYASLLVTQTNSGNLLLAHQ